MDSMFVNTSSFASSKCLVALLPIFVMLFIIRRLLHVDYDPREPPVIRHWIPYIGHIIGIFRHGASYFESVNEKYHYPIYTLLTLTTRCYIVTSPTLAAIVQRASQPMSFYSIIMEVTKRLSTLDEPTMLIIRLNINREAGDWGLMPESHDMIAGALGPGPALHAMSEIQIQKLAEMLNETVATGEDGVPMGMQTWIRRLFSLSNAYAIYGPENLFAMHPELVGCFWEFEDGMGPLLADIFPAITVRKPYLARQKILAAMVEFVEKGRYKKASKMIQQRVSINLKHGLTTKMAGHAELIMLFGILGNAVATTFWLIANIFSCPPLLKDLRQEVVRAVTEDGATRTIDVGLLRSCPLLISTYRETLRVISNSLAARWVLGDTVMAEKYLLKKDSILLVASGVLHADKNVWGSDADVFNPRSLEERSPVSLPPTPKGVPSAAYRAFGGGSVICPGRHFAQTEILAFTAAVLLGFDITTPTGDTISLPQRDNSRIPLTTTKPIHDIQMKIKRREGMDRVRWTLKL